MSPRRSWPPPGWRWSADLETYVPESSPLARIPARRLAELELEARALAELREFDEHRKRVGLPPVLDRWNLPPSK